jgi:hypothetical protein
MPSHLWTFALQCFLYTYNRSVTIKNDKQTPIERCFNRKPDVSHLKPFGSTAFVYINQAHRDKQKSKLDDRRVKCTFVGYHHEKKGYLFLNSNNKLLESTFEDAEFMESSTVKPTKESSKDNSTLTARSINITLQHNDELSDYQSVSEQSEYDYQSVSEQSEYDTNQSDNPVPVSIETNIEDGEHNNDRESSDDSNSHNHIPPAYEPIHGTNRYKHKTKGIVEDQLLTAPADKDILAPPTITKTGRRKQVDYTKAFSAVTDLLICFDSDTQKWSVTHHLRTDDGKESHCRRTTTGDAPQTYKDIASRKDKDQWYKASDEEITQLHTMHTWELVPPPPIRTILKNKWVFKLKRDTDGNPTRYKARLNACLRLQGLTLLTPTHQQPELNLYAFILLYVQHLGSYHTNSTYQLPFYMVN